MDFKRMMIFGLIVFIVLSTFATILALGSKVQQVGRTSQSTETRPRGVSGIQHLAVILVQFRNLIHTRQQIAIEQTLVKLNQYYQAVSYGQISIDWTVRGWFTLPNASNYYGQDLQGAPSGYENGRSLLIDSINVAQDGTVLAGYQHVAVVHAGYDQRITNDTADLWPHFWSELNVTAQDGTRISSGLYVSEFSEVGAYAHEFGHILGLPDLYPPESSKKPDIVGWLSLMDSGSWLPRYPNESSPGGLDSWSLLQLGWIEADNVSLTRSGTNLTISPLEYAYGPRVVRILTQSTLYYLVELRTQRGADSALPAEALVVYTVNESARQGYEGYGVLNSTYFMLRDGNVVDIPFIRSYELAILLTNCNRNVCAFSIGSILVHIFSLNIAPSTVEVFTTYPMTVTITDIEGEPSRI